MARISGKTVLLAALMAAVACGVFFLHAHTGASEGEDSGPVRMAVDPTILPVVLPDGSEVPAGKLETPDSNATSAEAQSESPLETEPRVESEPPSGAEAVADVPTSAKTKLVQAITMTTDDAGCAIVIKTNGPVGDMSYMNLYNPRRLVVDLREPWKSKAKNVVRALEGPVKHVVVGEHSDRLRLVVHFRTEPTERIEPVFTRNDKSVIVSVPLK